MAKKAVPPLVGEGMAVRQLTVRAKDVAFLKGIVEAHEGLCALFAEHGGDLTLAAPRCLEAELDAFARDMAREFGGIYGGDGLRTTGDLPSRVVGSLAGPSDEDPRA